MICEAEKTKLKEHLKSIDDKISEILIKAIEENNEEDIKLVIKQLLRKEEFSRIRYYFEPIITERAEAIYNLLADLPFPLTQYILAVFIAKYLDDTSKAFSGGAILYIICNIFSDVTSLSKMGALGDLCIDYLAIWQNKK